ncbi:SGNH/GDSL hydrolase family protein [Thiocapsa roseopersicina]|uniref:GDSL-like Lipase/Acylhydrolase family protein n=1 Tax=Thiocapsa roseopersicina TaxID=1058 RepID=A0A1H2ZNX9_THIRO|nr:SGNH/GDSL hydrolase family protein [Thiocapsa roseopersicina]SDX19097.1 GDSL-like Lipase/Acylhydrolase family protein [Thiocapsa roseopersicina]
MSRRGRHRPSIVTWREYLRQVFDHEGFPTFPDLNLLAEGDSWFTISGLPPYNLLFELRFRKHTRIVNCGTPGDTIVSMASIARSQQLREALSPGIKRWDAILLSGGGNDLINAAGNIVLPKNNRPTHPGNPADFCDQAALQDLIEDVQDGYRRMAAMRDVPGGPSRGVPILAHTYDYATPRDAPAIFGSLGPWLHRAFNDREIPPEDRVELADCLTDRLANGLLALTAGSHRIPDLIVVDTRGTLTRAALGHRGDSHDWQNEIHPNGGGYEKLAKRIEPVLEGLLGN